MRAAQGSPAGRFLWTVETLVGLVWSIKSKARPFQAERARQGGNLGDPDFRVARNLLRWRGSSFASRC
jgi:hypothetical protein